MNQSTTPAMPMGAAASTTRLSLSPADLLPSPPSKPVVPPTASRGLIGTGPAPSAPPPAGPPNGITVEMQADGSSIYRHGPTGVVLGVNKAAKLPPALQPPTQPLGQPQLPTIAR